MNYVEVQSKIRSGDILAFSHSGWEGIVGLFSYLIQFFTRSKFCHTGTAWVAGGRVFVIEAVSPRVRIFPLTHKGDFYWIPTEVPWGDITEACAMAYVGDKYSVWQAIKAFFGFPPKDRYWECAELTQRLAWLDGLNLKSNPTPANIVRDLQELGKTLTFVKNS